MKILLSFLSFLFAASYCLARVPHKDYNSHPGHLVPYEDYKDYDSPGFDVLGKVKEVKVLKYYPAYCDTLPAGDTFDMEEIMQYDMEGRLQSIQTKNINAPGYKNWHNISSYTYYGDDSIMQYVYEGKHPGRPKTNQLASPWLKTVVKYDKAHHIIEKDFYVYNHRFLEKILYNYDKRGFLVSKEHYGQTIYETHKDSFVNDSSGRNLEILFYGIDSSLAKHIIFCSYDEKNNPLVIKDDRLGTFIFRYQYDNAGNWTKLTRFKNEAIVKNIDYITTRKITYY